LLHVAGSTYYHTDAITGVGGKHVVIVTAEGKDRHPRHNNVGRNGFSSVFGRVREGKFSVLCTYWQWQHISFAGTTSEPRLLRVIRSGVGRDTYRAEVLISALFVNRLVTSEYRWGEEWNIYLVQLAKLF
jgi:hypothetical protein